MIFGRFCLADKLRYHLAHLLLNEQFRNRDRHACNTVLRKIGMLVSGVSRNGRSGRPWAQHGLGAQRNVTDDCALTRCFFLEEYEQTWPLRLCPRRRRPSKLISPRVARSFLIFAARRHHLLLTLPLKNAMFCNFRPTTRFELLLQHFFFRL